MVEKKVLQETRYSFIPVKGSDTPEEWGLIIQFLSLKDIFKV